MKPRAHSFRPALTTLEGRTLLSTLTHPGHPGAVVVIAAAPSAIHGSLNGSFSDLSGSSVSVKGSGKINGIGPVVLSGTLAHGPAFSIAGGTLLLSSQNGTISLAVQGTIPNLYRKGAKVTYQYAITSGTGAFAGATGSGLIKITAKNNHHGPFSGAITAKF
ncbi:MAG: hypothetical protein JWN86_1172 [Planctomycetota bacterium]|nr:hypothetical protein [Planctomycetota bacterium]